MRVDQPYPIQPSPTLSTLKRGTGKDSIGLQHNRMARTSPWKRSVGEHQQQQPPACRRRAKHDFALAILLPMAAGSKKTGQGHESQN